MSGKNWDKIGEISEKGRLKKQEVMVRKNRVV